MLLPVQNNFSVPTNVKEVFDSLLDSITTYTLLEDIYKLTKKNLNYLRPANVLTNRNALLRFTDSSHTCGSKCHIMSVMACKRMSSVSYNPIKAKERHIFFAFKLKSCDLCYKKKISIENRIASENIEQLSFQALTDIRSE